MFAQQCVGASPIITMFSFPPSISSLLPPRYWQWLCWCLCYGLKVCSIWYACDHCVQNGVWRKGRNVRENGSSSCFIMAESLLIILFGHLPFFVLSTVTFSLHLSFSLFFSSPPFLSHLSLPPYSPWRSMSVIALRRCLKKGTEKGIDWRRGKGEYILRY